MSRRTFHRLALAGVGALTAPRAGARVSQATPRVDGKRLEARLRALAEFGKTSEGGIRRVAYSPADLAARDFCTRAMKEAGLEARVDLAGNLLGRRPGRTGDRPPILFGSHIDSVPDGGNYDGQVGSMAAIEVAHTLSEAGIETLHPLEVVIFQNEEGGKTGSRALAGELTASELDRVTHSGKTIREGIALLGGDPDRLEEAKLSPGDVHAYLELHVEQGDVLETEGVDIGVVEGIVGIKRWDVTFRGFANHAGTTPMERRRDALLAAGRFIDAVYRTATSVPGRQVATVGRIEAVPGAPNVIAGTARLTLEIRDLTMEGIDQLHDRIREEAERIARESGTEVGFELFYVSRAAPTHERLRRVVEDAARRLGLSSLRMPSGAGHDAQSIALLAPVGMIFVPSIGGISHSPRERSRPEDIANGADVLLHSVLAVDRQP